MKAVTGHLWAKWNENSNDERKFETLTRQTEPVFFNLLLEVQWYVNRNEKKKRKKKNEEKLYHAVKFKQENI